MNLFNRVRISIQRRFSKTILLFLILFFCSTLITCSLSIGLATNTVKDKIRATLGANVVIGYNNELENNKCHQYVIFPDVYALERYEYDRKVEQVFNEAIINENVSFSEAQYALFYDENYLSTEQVYNTGVTTKESLEQLIDWGFMGYLYGVNNSNFYELLDEKVTIVEGRTFTEEEIKSGANVIVVSHEQYKVEGFCSILETRYYGDDVYEFDCYHGAQDINVGDTIAFQCDYVKDGQKNSHITEYEVIGIYVSDEGYAPTFTTNQTLINEYNFRVNELGINPNSMQGSLYINKFRIKLNNPYVVEEYSNHLQDSLEKANLLERKVISSVDAYEAVASPLESLDTITTLIFVIAIVCTMLIVSLVNVLFLKDRKQEIGIYVALGESKKKVISQILFEILIIGILAISCSIIVGNQFGNVIANKMLETEVLNQQEVIEDRLESVEYIVVDEVSSLMVLQSYEVNLTLENIVLIYIVSVLVLALSVIVPITYVLKLNAKEILL